MDISDLTETTKLSDFVVHLGSFWLAGFAGGVHCLGMCGGLASALGLAAPYDRTSERREDGTETADGGADAKKATLSRRVFLLSPPPPVAGRKIHTGLLLLAANLGRISSYGAIGLLLGALGAAVAGTLHAAEWRVLLYAFSQALVFLLGLYLAGLTRWPHGFEYPGRWLWRWLAAPFARLLPPRTMGSAFLAGLLWGWLPCGLVYVAALAALASASIGQGGLLMLAFGLGTLPNLLAMGLGAGSLRTRIQRPAVRRTLGIALCFWAIWTFWAWGVNGGKHQHSGHGAPLSHAAEMSAPLEHSAHPGHSADHSTETPAVDIDENHDATHGHAGH